MAPSRAGQSWHRALPICPLPRATWPQIRAFSSFPPPKLEILVLSPFSLVQQSKKKPQRMSPTRGRRRLLTRESLGSLTHRSATRSLESNSDPKVFFLYIFPFFVCFSFFFLFLKCLSSTGIPPPPSEAVRGCRETEECSTARPKISTVPEYTDIHIYTPSPKIPRGDGGEAGARLGELGGCPKPPQNPKTWAQDGCEPPWLPLGGVSVWGGSVPPPLLAAFWEIPAATHEGEGLFSYFLRLDRRGDADLPGASF